MNLGLIVNQPSNLDILKYLREKIESLAQSVTLDERNDKETDEISKYLKKISFFNHLLFKLR